MKRIGLLLMLVLLCSVNNQVAALGGTTGIQVEARFSGVKVYINGTFRGETAEDAITGKIYCRIDLDPGDYKIRCEYINFQPTEDMITVPADLGFVKHIVTFSAGTATSESLGKTESKASVQTGTILVRSIPSDASVELDGRLMQDLTDCRLKDVAVGLRKVRVFFPKVSLDITFRLRAEETLTVLADFTKKTITTDAKYTVNFDSTPSGGTLFIDNKQSGKLPMSLKLDNGRYSIKITREDYFDYSETIEINSSDFINIQLKKLERKVTVMGTPSGGLVTLISNGKEKYLGAAPLEATIEPGKYSLKVAKKDQIEYRTFESNFEILRSDQGKKIEYSLSPIAASISGEIDPDYMPPTDLVFVAGKSIGSLKSLNNYLISPGRQRVSIADRSFFYFFEDGHKYLIHPLFLIPTADQELFTLSNLPNKKMIPSQPNYKNEYVTKYRYESDLTLAPTGFVLFGLGGALLGGLLNAGTGGIVTLGALGGIIGVIVGTNNMPKKAIEDGIEYDSDAAATNIKLRREWESQKADVEKYNEELLQITNKKISEDLEKIIEINKSRNAILINDRHSVTPNA